MLFFEIRKSLYDEGITLNGCILFFFQKDFGLQYFKKGLKTMIVL